VVQTRKIEMVGKIAELVRGAKAAVLVDFRGMTVREATQLRRRCREVDVDFHVVKNRLAKLALGQIGLRPPDEVLRGPTALAVAMSEPTACARVLTEFRKDCEHAAVKGGFLGTAWLDAKAVEQLARVESREILLQRLAGSLRGPLVRLARVLGAPVVQLAMVLKAAAEKKAAT